MQLVASYIRFIKIGLLVIVSHGFSLAIAGEQAVAESVTTAHEHSLQSTALQSERTITVRLPTSYHEQTKYDYPVVIVLDGETSVDYEFRTEKDRQYQGMADVDFTLSMNFSGAPSMTREEFSDLRRNPQPIFGGSIKVKVPTGQYNSDRAINVGANRWALRPQLGYIMPLHPRWLLEFAAGAWFFSDNDDFLGLKKEQDPILALEGHLVRRFHS